MKPGQWKIPDSIRGGKPSQFVFFFFVSCLLWFLIKLPNRYTSTVSLRPEYSGVPQEKLLVDPPKNIKVDINAKGMRLLGMKYFGRNVDIDLSALRKKTSDTYYLLAGDLRKQLAGSLPEDVEVRRFAGDTLFFSLGENITKAITVIPRTDITFAKDYRIYDSLTVEPENVEVFGPDVEVNKLDTLFTVKLTMKNVSENINSTVALDVPSGFGHLKFKDKNVIIKARVERFSENKLTVPVFVINVPEDKEVKTFPSEIEIKFTGALRDISKLKPSDFKVICDYRAVTDSVNYLPLKVSEMPETVKETELSRHGVEILVKQPASEM